MEYRVDQKGKFFTEHVTKRSVPVVACIGELIVRGTIHLTTDNRLKDELNAEEPFIAITQAQVSERRGKRPLYKTEALIVNKAHINWIFPRETDLPK